MKTKKLYRILFVSILMVFSNYLRSQDCNAYYTLVNGNEYEMTSYDTKDNPEGKSINEITNVVTTTEGTVATVESTSINKKNEVAGTATFAIRCEGMIMYVEMKSVMTPEDRKAV